MGKYEPLNSYLSHQGANEVPLTFAQIEALIGGALPPVARKHRAWWSNNPRNSVVTKAWLDAGYRSARVDMGSEKLVFERREGDQIGAPSPTGGLLERLRARLGGTVTIAPGVDITEPLWELPEDLA